MTTTQKFEKTKKTTFRKFRTTVPRDLFKELAVEAAREELTVNDILNRAAVQYLDHVKTDAESAQGTP